jgi:hypothetical protein
MDFILSILLGTRLLSGLTGGLGGAPPAHFGPPQIILTSQDVRVSAELQNGYTPDLKRFAQTSTPILLYFFIELHRPKVDEPDARVVLENSLVYDMIRKEYCVKLGESRDTVRFGALDSAARAVCTFRDVPVCLLDALDPAASYYVLAYAVLGKTTVEALHNKPIDLMYYWDYKRPSFRTEPYRGEQLLVNRKPHSQESCGGNADVASLK